MCEGYHSGLTMIINVVNAQKVVGFSGFVDISTCTRVGMLITGLPTLLRIHMKVGLLISHNWNVYGL